LPKREYPPKSYFDALLDYSPMTGLLTWKKRPREEFKNHHAYNQHLLRAGNRLGGTINGALVCTLEGRRLQTLRIIWVMMTGSDPDRGTSILVKDGNLENTRWQNIHMVKVRSIENLRDKRREIIRTEKQRAKVKIPDSITYNGYALQPWCAWVGTFNLGRFDKKIDAEKALARALFTS
jgi:hypothetical protein